MSRNFVESDTHARIEEKSDIIIKISQSRHSRRQQVSHARVTGGISKIAYRYLYIAGTPSTKDVTWKSEFLCSMPKRSPLQETKI